jgi:hypothetical protein
MIESLRRGFVEDEDAKRKRGPIGMTAYEELRYQRLQSKRGSSSGGGFSTFDSRAKKLVR